MFSFVYRWRCCVVLRRIGDPFVHFPVSNWSLAPYVSGSEVPNVATFLLTRRLQLLQPQPAAVSLHVLWNATELSQQRQNPRQSNPFCRSTKSAEGLEPEVTASGETQLMHRCKCCTLTLFVVCISYFTPLLKTRRRVALCSCSCVRCGRHAFDFTRLAHEVKAHAVGPDVASSFRSGRHGLV